MAKSGRLVPSSAVLAMVLFASTSAVPRTAHAAPAISAPNIVIILADDQRWDTLRLMPHVRQDLMAPGVTFDNAFVENSLCCPSRSAILTGNDSHTTGIFTNVPPYGGYPVFHARGEESSTIATWLHGAGYRTALAGKYLNGYTGILDIPPGWDRWAAFSSSPLAYYNYTLNVDGSMTTFGGAPSDYSTDVLAGYAIDAIRSTPQSQPAFVYFAPFAPHAPSIPAVRDIGSVLAPPSRWPPNFNEKNVTDKPRYVRKRKPASTKEMSAQIVNTVESLGALDNAVHDIVQALSDTNRLSNSIVIFTSDNGFMFGEHRFVGKEAPYDESIRVPMVVRYDRVVAAAGSRDARLVMNTDIAPTLASAAGLTPPPTDGMSFLPLLQGAGAALRGSMLIEHLADNWVGTPPSYCALRTPVRMFVRYSDGFEELYNLVKDPYELTNRARDHAYRAVVIRLRAKLRSMCTPRPPGMPPF